MICIEILPEDRELIENLVDSNEHIQCMCGRKFQGDPQTIQLLIDVLKETIPIIATVIITLIQSRKHIVIRYNGIEIKGINEKNALSIIEKLCEEDKRK